MASLLEMAQQIVTAHAATTPMTTSELLAEIQKIYTALQSLEAGEMVSESVAEESAAPVITLKQAFRTNEVVCMVCGKGGMKTLVRHLNQAHEMKPTAYRKQFGIPKTQSLMSKAYSAKRKEIAAGMDLGGNLVKARAARQINLGKSRGKKK